MRVSVVLGLLAAVAMLAVAFPVSAQNACWSRVYTPEHLTAHPDQLVAEMMLSLRPPASDGVASGELWISLRPEEGASSMPSHAAEVICGPPVAGQRDCSVACDGGLFGVAHRASDGSVLLTNEASGLAFLGCGAEDFDDYYFLNPDAEHRAFRLFDCDS